MRISEDSFDECFIALPISPLWYYKDDKFLITCRNSIFLLDLNWDYGGPRMIRASKDNDVKRIVQLGNNHVAAMVDDSIKVFHLATGLLVSSVEIGSAYDILYLEKDLILSFSQNEFTIWQIVPSSYQLIQYSIIPYNSPKQYVSKLRLNNNSDIAVFLNDNNLITGVYPEGIQLVRASGKYESLIPTFHNGKIAAKAENNLLLCEIKDGKKYSAETIIENMSKEIIPLFLLGDCLVYVNKSEENEIYCHDFLHNISHETGFYEVIIRWKEITNYAILVISESLLTYIFDLKVKRFKRCTRIFGNDAIVYDLYKP
jgi:hypothetical protein